MGISATVNGPQTPGNVSSFLDIALSLDLPEGT
jgi:hypothetical protein